MDAKLNKATLIARPAELESLAARLAREPILAVDTESNSLYAYRERVCLVQISTAKNDYLIDPLAVRELAPLGPIFTDPGVEKIFHAAEYDLICLRRDFGFQFANLFDTMQAARILGRTAFGLGSLLEAEFGVVLDKRYQRANWGQRPLPPYLRDYAQLDTHYLIPLRERMDTELKAVGQWDLAAEDFKRLCRINDSALEEKPENNHCFRSIGDLRPQQYMVLLELCAYRESAARQLDRPLFKVIGDKTLLEIAEACPKDLDELQKLPGMTRNQIGRHGKAILQAVQLGLSVKPVRPKRPERPDEQVLARLELLRQWRKKRAQALGVESDVVLPRDLLNTLAEQRNITQEDIARILQDTPWRLKQYGNEILALLNPNL
jgi:ribonuclease D